MDAGMKMAQIKGNRREREDDTRIWVDGRHKGKEES